MLRDPKTHLGAFLGCKLQQARLDAGFPSQEKLAAHLHIDRTVVTKTETGERPPSPELLAAWCEATGIADPTMYAELSELAHVVNGATPEWFQPWLGAEGICTSLRIWHPTLIPGLFHTEEYAEAVIRGIAPDNVDELVAARLARAKVLDREDPPEIVAVIDEYALHHMMGSATIMAGQLDHLAELSRRPNVVVQVLPSGIGAHATLGGAFDIASGEGLINDLLRMEGVPLDVTTETSSVVRTAAIAFDKSRAEALPRTQSRDLIVRLKEELWTPKA